MKTALKKKEKKKQIAPFFNLSTLFGDDCTHDTVALLWKMSVSDPLCVCGLHMSPRPPVRLICSDKVTHHGNRFNMLVYH